MKPPRFCCFVVFALVMSVCNAALGDYDSDRKAAMKLLEKREYGKAKAAFLTLAGGKATQAQKNDSLKHAADIAILQKDTAQAMAIAKRINDNEASLKLLIELLGKKDKAEDVIKACKDEDFATWASKEAGAHGFYLRGGAYSQLRKADLATADLEQAVKMLPKDAYYWYELAKMYRNRNRDAKKAAAAFRKVFECAGKSYNWFVLDASITEANIYLHQARPEEALKVLQRYNLKETQAMGQYWRISMIRTLGSTYAALGRDREAMAMFAKANNAPGAVTEKPRAASRAASKPSLTSRATPQTGTLMVGLAKADITPPVGQPLGGFVARLQRNGGKSRGIHDRLYARVLFLKKDETSVAIVSLDMLLFCSPKVVDEARKKWGVDHVILNSSHSHSTPIPTTGGMTQWSNLNVNPADVMDFGAFSKDPWYAKMERSIVAAIGEASGNLFPARIAAGQGTLESAYLAHNRRQAHKSGGVTMLWMNPKRLATSPIDHTVRVLRVDDQAGKTRAILANFACHPVTLGGGNYQISADFPGAMVAHIEKEMGPDCMGMFLQGAEGDVDPYEMNLNGAYGFMVVKSAGEGLARKALEIARSIDMGKAKTARLKAADHVISVAHRQNTSKVLKIGVTTVVINDDIAMVSVPGEPFVQHQIDLAAKSPRDYTFMLGVSHNGTGLPYAMYLPTKKAVGEGGYGAASATFLEVGTGERIVDEAVKSIGKLGATK